MNMENISFKLAGREFILQLNKDFTPELNNLPYTFKYKGIEGTIITYYLIDGTNEYFIYLDVWQKKILDVIRVK